MRRRPNVLLVAVIVALLAGCGGSGGGRSGRAELEWIEVTADGTGFELASSGEPFVAWGFNYDHDEELRLLEDYWIAEWSKVEEDFREMEALGARVVRLHLQLGRFMTDPTTPDDRALDRLRRVVALAEDLGLYLDLTGLATYRASDVPAWYRSLTDEDERWAAHAAFWEAVAARVRDSPAVFAYNLMNEPVVPVGRLHDDEWLGPEFGGFHFTQRITLDQAGRDREEIARRWTARMTEAIRVHDARHLITIGMLPGFPGSAGSGSGFSPEGVGDLLDFVSVHVYPESARVDEAVTVVDAADVGRPVLVEETYNLNCSIAELENFITDSSDVADGWLGFYWGETPDELDPTNDVADALHHDWLELFQELAPAVGAVADPGTATVRALGSAVACARIDRQL